VIPYAPGGGFDVYPRVVAPVMEKYLPNMVNIVPINIAAGAGSRGVTQLYRSKPDGYRSASSTFRAVHPAATAGRRRL